MTARRNDDFNGLVKRVTSAAFRAVARRRDFDVVYGGNEAGIRGAQARLPIPSSHPTADELSRLRGTADSVALRVRHHNASLHQRRSPVNETARAAFDALEETRVHMLGRSQLEGVARNLDALLDYTCKTKGYAFVEGRDDAFAADALSLLVRERLSNQSLPAQAAALVDPWRPAFEKHCLADMKKLASSMDDQASFADAAIHMIRALDLMTDDDPSLDNEDQEQIGESPAENSPEESPQTQGTESGSEEAAASESGMEAQPEGADGAKESSEEKLPGEGGMRPAGPTTRKNSRLADDTEHPAYRAYT
ncbi:MAG: cobaltochelatase subunit CobT, partial [Hyphomicrobiales bacterium]|nr:cobaltochelatase subunit CobT [Hyphomicrobiales bacterium]